VELDLSYLYFFMMKKWWKRELKEANEGKIAEPYYCPESYIRLLPFFSTHQPYKQTE
jgi:hypothetical protein